MTGKIHRQLATERKYESEKEIRDYIAVMAGINRSKNSWHYSAHPDEQRFYVYPADYNENNFGNADNNRIFSIGVGVNLANVMCDYCKHTHSAMLVDLDVLGTAIKEIKAFLAKDKND